MKKLKKILTTIVCVCLMAAMAQPIQSQAADIGNEAVREACKGVVQILLTYVDSDNYEWTIQSGSGFFIGGEAGADTIVTNSHVVTPYFLADSEEREAVKEIFGRDIVNDIQIKVVVDRDLTKTAKLSDFNSTEYDLAVITLDEPLSNMNILTLGLEEPAKTQQVYALGFPDVPQVAKDKHFYTTEEVTITSGTISDVTEVGQTEHIQHECLLSSGNSGGPLVNENGEVVGINRSGINDQYYYSVKVSELTKLLDKMSIPYNMGSVVMGNTGDEEKNGEADPVNTSALAKAIEDAEAIDRAAYTEDSVSFLEAAVEDGKTVLNNAEATQEQVNAAASDIQSAQKKLEEKKGLPLGVIIGIVAAVVVVIIIIIIVVINSKKKKKAQPTAQQMTGYSAVPPTPQNAAPQMQNMTPPTPQIPPVPPIDMGGSDETSVLNEGAGQTTVLSAQAVPTATLKRVSTGETAIINKAVYSIGKEKSKVDFCISNNSSVSRVHVKVYYENGAFYVEDQNATNFTFVNGNKVNPGQKVRIGNGDRVKLSDEEFEFKA